MARVGVSEAALVETASGLKPEGDGWFVVNVAEARSVGIDDGQYAFPFEGVHGAFPHFGVNITVLGAGKAAAMYHAEDAQEAFLVLQGRCVLIVEDRERPLRQWDFVYCPPNTAHVIVGAGPDPCAVLMVGARIVGRDVVFPVGRVAARYGVSVSEETGDGAEAYAGWAPLQERRFPWPPT
jgi:uncharacterized cupin superfamily protein